MTASPRPHFPDFNSLPQDKIKNRVRGEFFHFLFSNPIKFFCFCCDGAGVFNRSAYVIKFKVGSVN